MKRILFSTLLMVTFVLLSCNTGEVEISETITTWPESDSLAPVLLWSRSYGGSEEESHAHYIIETSDRGFVQIGETGFIDDNSAKILIVKTDEAGELLWKKEIGSKGYNLGNSLVEAPNGDIIAVGSLQKDALLVRLDGSSGEILWQKTWDLGTEDAFEGVALSESGGFIVTGYANGLAENTFYNEGEGYLIITDSEGNEIFSKDIKYFLSTGYRVITQVDGYLIMGMPSLENSSNCKIVKCDFEGTVLWGKALSGSTLFWGFDVDSVGNMYLAGHDTDGPLSDNYDILTVKLSHVGEELWQQWSGQPRGYNSSYIHDETWGLRTTPDGGCIVVAGSGDEYDYHGIGHPTGSSDRWVTYLIKYDAEGTKEWEKIETGLDVWNEEGDWAGEDITLTTDGGFLVAYDNGGFGFAKFGYE